MAMSKSEMIDTHQHLWVMSERSYDWILPEYGVIYDDFTPKRLAPQIAKSGVTSTVLVQAADTYDDTFYMLHVAKTEKIVDGVVGYVPLHRTDEAKTAIDSFVLEKYFKGVRNLTHNYADPRYENDDKWILRKSVIETLRYVAKKKLTFDYVSVNDGHLSNVAVLAKKIPELKIVIDHIGKPDVANKAFGSWAKLMEAAAKHPNVYAKISGLNTVSGPGWTVADWQPYFDFIVEKFGAKRTMLGGDWPVILLHSGDDYIKVWKAQAECVSKFSAADQAWIKFKTAKSFYRIGKK
jgi:L-fuconolactonase